MLTVVVERRMIGLNIRRLKWFRRVMLSSFITAVTGLGLSIVGVQLKGLNGAAAIIVWFLAVVSIGGLAFMLTASMATTEIEEDGHRPPANDGTTS